MEQNKIPKEPFRKIALSCSGGGYRAASFHLGVMSYLNRVQLKGTPLLENVKFISTVSGGTITGAVYALRKQKGDSFKQIYDFLMGQLHTLDLVKLSIEKLNPDKGLLTPTKRKNLINSFAELYDQYFTFGKTFATFNDMKSHLETVVFNSTEFNNGINFRFRNKGTGYFGNNIMRVDPSTAEEVKISDAMAASTCFPGGFEPIIWPDDFVHQDAEKLRDLCNTSSGTGIMDGGIYDNQGIQSILLYKEGTALPYFDLVIISDVASPYMQPFKPFAPRSKDGLRTLTISHLKRKIANASRAIDLILVTIFTGLALLPFIWNYSNSLETGIMIGLAVTPIVLLIAKQLLLSKVKGVIKYVRNSLINLIPDFFQIKLAKLRIENISLHRAEPLLFDRLNSVITLLMDVFLKVVRRLNYGDLYNNDAYSYRRITALVKELTEIDFNNKGKSSKGIINSSLKGDYQAVVGPKIKHVVEEASSFGTTLWFTDDNQLHNMLDKLVATGQMTMCYNLIEYLEQIIFTQDAGFDNLDLETKADFRSVYSTLLIDWAYFKDNPMFMVEELKK